jgi:hypothetical protein
MTMAAHDDGSAVRHDDYFHTGIVVHDFDAAQAELGDAVGVTWGPGGEMEVPVFLAEGGARTISFRYAYTEQGPPYLELVRAVPGTLWMPSGAGQAHHLGYWSPDPSRASRRLHDAGVPRVASVGVSSDDDQPFAVYHQPRAGVYIELIDAALRHAMFGPSATEVSR